MGRKISADSTQWWPSLQGRGLIQSLPKYRAIEYDYLRRITMARKAFPKIGLKRVNKTVEVYYDDKKVIEYACKDEDDARYWLKKLAEEYKRKRENYENGGD